MLLNGGLTETDNKINYMHLNDILRVNVNMTIMIGSVVMMFIV